MPATFAALRINMYDVYGRKRNHPHFIQVLFCYFLQLESILRFSICGWKLKKKTTNEFGLFISFNIIVFYVSMIYNKKEKYSEFIQYVTTQWNIVL